MCQADGIGALNADSNSFSRVVNLDFDKIIIERNAELSPTTKPANSSSSDISCPFLPLMVLLFAPN